MIITTTPTIENRKIKDYCGIVSGCRVLTLFGGGKMLQRSWDMEIENAIKLILGDAKDRGADAIIGVTIQTYRSGAYDYMYVSGTAVKLE